MRSIMTWISPNLIPFRVENEEVFVTGEQDVNERWLREISNSSLSQETCNLQGICEKTSVMVVPRVVIESELSLDAVELIENIANKLILLRDRYAFDGFTFECPLTQWRPLVSLFR